MSNYTDGVWTVQEWDRKDSDGSLVTNGYQVVSVQQDRQVLISACTIEDEDCSDLHLIASAPDLLHALELLLAMVDFGDDFGYIDGHGFIDIGSVKDAARAAIAKAKGVRNGQDA